MGAWLYEWERRMTPLVASAIIMSWSECLPFFAPRVKDQIFLAEKHAIRAFFGAEAMDAMGAGVMERLERPGFLKDFSFETEKLGRDLVSLGKTLDSADAADPAVFDRVFRTYWQASCPVVTIRSFNRIGLSKLDGFVSEKIKDPVLKNETLALLTAPTRQSLSHREHIEFEELVLQARKHFRLFQQDVDEVLPRLSDFPDLKKAIDLHLERFGWFPCGYDNEPSWDAAFLVRQIQKALLQTKGKSHVDVSRISEKRQNRLDELDASDEIRLVANALSEFTFYKDYVREYLNQFQFLWQPYLRRLSQSMGLEGFACTDLTGWQIQEVLTGKSDLPKNLLGQSRYVVGVEAGNRFIKAGRDADPVFSKILDSLAHSDVLSGVCACPGVAQGRVQVVFSAADFKDTEPGSVLVTTMTTPELMHAMKRAKAIVTDEGGITCHAAIVSRELGIPCVVGLKTATRALKTGDWVHVDATAGWVKKLPPLREKK